MLIILIFAVLLAVKLAAIGLVYHAGAAVALPIVAACLLIAHRLEPTAATPEPPARQSAERGRS